MSTYLQECRNQLVQKYRKSKDVVAGEDRKDLLIRITGSREQQGAAHGTVELSKSLFDCGVKNLGVRGCVT